MPEGRLIKNEIAEDYRLGHVPVEAELLYVGMMRRADREGRLEANPQAVKRKFFPHRDYSNEQIEQWLKDLCNQKDGGLGLIELYVVDEIQYLWLPRFNEGQSSNWHNYFKDREAESHIPPPPDIKTQRKEGKKQAPGSAVTIVDEKLKGIVNCYEAHIAIVTPAISDRLKDISNTYLDGWFQKAVAEAVQYGAKGHNLRYIETILERWHAGGISPLEPESKGDSGNIAGLQVEE